MAGKKSDRSADASGVFHELLSPFRKSVEGNKLNSVTDVENQW
jgi:hypothetical protein